MVTGLPLGERLTAFILVSSAAWLKDESLRLSEGKLAGSSCGVRAGMADKSPTEPQPQATSAPTRRLSEVEAQGRMAETSRGTKGQGDCGADNAPAPRHLVMGLDIGSPSSGS